MSTRATQWYAITNLWKCFGILTVDGKLCIGDTSLRKYMPKSIEPKINRNMITCEFKTCISAMLLQ